MSHCQSLSTSCHLLLPSFPPPPPRPSGMKNRIPLPAPQEPLAQILQAYPMRTPKYRAGWLTDIQTYICISRIYAQAASHMKWSTAIATILLCWYPSLCHFLSPEPDQGSLTRPFSFCPAEAWKGCGWGAVSLYLMGVGGTQSTWPPLTWSLTAPLTEPEIASLPPTLREAGSGSCCVVLCWGGWNGDGTLHSSAYILSLPSVNHIMQGPMLDTAVGGS